MIVHRYRKGHNACGITGMPHNPITQEKIDRRILGWLTDRGYQLIIRNWKYCHGEVDIIASRLDRLHFIGVATQNYPETEFVQQGITRRKMLSIFQAAQQYIKRNPQWKEAIIDVLTITLKQEEPVHCAIVSDIRIRC